MQVIFLDIDGVLNSERFNRTLEEQHRQLGHHEVCECFKLARQIDRSAVARLNRLVSATSAKIVVSSSWRTLFDPPELRRILSEHGLVAEIIGATPDGSNDAAMLNTYGAIDRVFRGHEIDFWLRQHPEVDRFVILDDGSDMEMHSSRLVQTDSEEGLLDEHVDQAIRMLSCPASSAGIHCHVHRDGCPETLTLERTTTAPSSHEDDYQELMPALDAAAISLGWRLYQSVWWCPTHVVARGLACARCLAACPGCSCVGGPRADAVDGGNRS